jgi:4-aminobutyrate aminotransferase/(S)-3-amino-2-methylpropionate transaminase
MTAQKHFDRMKRLSLREKDVLSRIEHMDRGPKTKRILRESVKYESMGHLYYGAFEEPIVYESARGAVVTDVDGKEYLDLIDGWSTQNAGNCHPRIVKAIREQAGKLITNAEMPCESRTTLAKRLTELSPGDFSKKVQFTTTGGEAVEFACKLARNYTGRPDILPFTGAYHGRTHYIQGLTADAHFRLWDFTIDQSYRLPYAYCYRCPFDKTYPTCNMWCSENYIRKLFEGVQYGLRDPKHDLTTVAAILVEPMQSHAGYIIPPDDFLRSLRSICDDFGILLIVDEIQTGWGRTGKLWGSDHSGVAPDIMTTGKALAGGIPFSATIAKADLLEDIGPSMHATTFGGTPLACAAALAFIDVLQEEKIVERAAKTGDYFLKRLMELQSKYEAIGLVQGKGLYVGMELVRDRKTQEPAPKETKAIQTEMLRNGVLIQRGGYFDNRLNFIPPLVITEGEIDRAVDALDKSIATINKS